MKESGMRSTRIKTKPNEIRRPKHKEGKEILINKKTKQNRTKVVLTDIKNIKDNGN